MNFNIECHVGCIEDHVWRIVLGEFSGTYVRFDAPFRKIPSKETGVLFRKIVRGNKMRGYSFSSR